MEFAAVFVVAVVVAAAVAAVAAVFAAAGLVVEDVDGHGLEPGPEPGPLVELLVAFVAVPAHAWLA